VLSYTGGSGTTFAWYTESCGGTPAGIGNDLIVYPTTTTTYYGRWENSCGVSDCESVTVTVNALAVEPSVVGAGNFSICSGENTYLIYAGGNGDVFKWYLNDCGDTEIGEGNSFEVSPSETTTYYGRWESSCGNSLCKSVTITVNDVPVAPIALSANNTSICSGESVILSYTGGDGEMFKWYTESCGDVVAGSGSILITNPSAETTYFGRWENACGVSDCESITISVNDVPESPIANYECSGTGGAATITVISPIGLGYTYSLNGFTFQEETVFNNVSDGSYVVTVAYNGCTATGDVIEFNCLCDNPSSINLSPTDGIICDNESVFQLFGNTFSGGATEVYVSHNGSGELNENTFTTSPFDVIYTMGADDYSGPVTVTITSNNPLGEPCSEASEQFVIYTVASPVIGLPETVNACAEELFEYTYSEPYNYIIWSDESTEDTYTNTFMTEGEYEVWVTVGNFYCESVDTMTVIVTICSDITNNIKSGDFELYPNPTNNNITLSISDYDGEITYTLFDINGKEIVSSKLFIENNYIEEIDLQNCLPGMYYIRLTTKDESINYKIIKN
ncbi:MAG TPA: T9SS type A sorting domain-containing protein, partial [Bacteroidales bacterium]|nr:T9SS type A sorting domain-containing protein [Bacteroidales bacterium]